MCVLRKLLLVFATIYIAPVQQTLNNLISTILVIISLFNVFRLSAPLIYTHTQFLISQSLDTSFDVALVHSISQFQIGRCVLFECFLCETISLSTFFSARISLKCLVRILTWISFFEKVRFLSLSFFRITAFHGKCI